MYILRFCLFFSKTFFCIFSLFKRVSNNNTQITKASVECYRSIYCTQT